MRTNICGGCGNEIDPEEAHGLCPACLVREGARVEPQGDPLRQGLEAKLQGQYRVIRLVGKGGMGAVYLARDLTLDREVAIKVVGTSAEGTAAYERFRREAKTAARLSHPNIVSLHAFGEIEGMPYFVMGFVRGESLAERIEREGRLPEEDVRQIMAQIADALDHAHRQGVVHRDIKPDNVLLDDESGRALLTDFGVARPLGGEETLTQTGSIIGTPQFMSPEQASGKLDIDGRSDIYSLGVMGYTMLTGRLPFEGRGMDVLTRHLSQAPTPVRTVAPGVSDATAQVIERCLAKDRTERWQDGRSLRMALGGAEENELPPAHESAAGSGMLGLLLLIGYFWFTTFVAHVSGSPEFDEIPFLILWYSTGPLIFVGSYLYNLGRLRREGLTPGRSLRLIWHEPAWWPTWYPKALRRRGNVWDRLPGKARAYRVLPLIPVVCGFAFAISAMAFGTPVVAERNALVLPLLVLGFALPILGWVVVGTTMRRELRRKGLAPAEITRLMFAAPPSRTSFWKRPHIASVLVPIDGTASQTRSDSPHDHMHAILRQADELAGPLRPLGSQASVAARQLVASIDDIDREIADLARNIEPGEKERLISKVETLEASRNPADGSASLRELLEKQLELIESLSARIEVAKDRRNRRIEMLRALALHVASLRSRQNTAPSELRELSDKVRQLCDEMQRRAFEALPTQIQPEVDATSATLERK